MKFVVCSESLLSSKRAVIARAAAPPQARARMRVLAPPRAASSAQARPKQRSNDDDGSVWMVSVFRRARRKRTQVARTPRSRRIHGELGGACATDGGLASLHCTLGVEEFATETVANTSNDNDNNDNWEESEETCDTDRELLARAQLFFENVLLVSAVHSSARASGRFVRIEVAANDARLAEWGRGRSG